MNLPTTRRAAPGEVSMQSLSDKSFSPQIKICGFTDPGEAQACARLGVDAIGLVFYPPSPRNLSLEQAAVISQALPPGVMPVGVFVNPAWDDLQTAIRRCGLSAVQLHGAEEPVLIDHLLLQGKVKVIKAVFASGPPGLNQAGDYRPTAFLVECGQGALPGGNAGAWDWRGAKPFAMKYPTILAGGLDAGNVGDAIAAALPAAVDASSGLETSPGRKDPVKVKQFVEAVRRSAFLYKAAGIAREPIF